MTFPYRRTCSVTALASAILTGTARAEPPLPAEPIRVPAQGVPLQLEVYRNGEATGLIAAFVQGADGELTAETAEIRAVGLVTPPREALLALHSLPGVDYRYDEANQRLFIEAEAAAVSPTVISLRHTPDRTRPSRDWGALLNYSLSATSGAHRSWGPKVDSGAGAFEGRAFGPFGLVSSTTAFAFVGGRTRAVRLDTSWIRNNPEDAVAWRAGDLISGGLAWTRPIRMGGLQFGRNFATRPDLVTTPTPDLATSAAAPSTLDVILGSSVLLSRRVSAGPVQVTDLPTAGRGVARLVLRDAFGAEQVVTASYFATPDLLRRGLADFSGEIGFARRGFGLRSADYLDQPVASGTVRYGWSDSITLQGHAEGGAGLIGAGAGVGKRFGATAIVSAAGAASHANDKAGGLLAVAFDGRWRGVSLSGQAQQTVGTYQDLASMTSDWPWTVKDRGRVEPPQQLAQFAAAAPLNLRALERWGDLPSVAVTYAHSRTRTGEQRDLVSGTLRYALHGGVSFQAAAYAARADRSDRGLFLVVTAPLGGGRTASAGADHSGGRTSGFAEVRQQEGPDPGAVAWRMRLDQGEHTGLAAEAVYRTPYARLSARAARTAGASEYEVRADGALVWLGAPFLAGDRIDGAFAAVDVGAPRVKVSFQNRPVGRSGPNGRLLVSRLNAYEPNLISIDAGDLPLSLTPAITKLSVSPPQGSGAWAAFGVTASPQQATVNLRLANGGVPPPGATASIDDGPFDQVVGYDGQVFLPRLAASNRIRVDLGDGASCAAEITSDPSHPDNPNGDPHAVDAVCR